MKHLFNDLSQNEKTLIREQYEGGIKINTSKFKKLVENKLGNSKPLISEQLNSIAKIYKKFGGNTDEHFFMLSQKVGMDNGFIYNCTDKKIRVGDGPQTYKIEDFNLDPIQTQKQIDNACSSQVTK